MGRRVTIRGLVDKSKYTCLFEAHLCLCFCSYVSVMASINLQEKANFTRLCRLLVDKGTEALRKTLDAIHPPANLPAVLNANRKSLLRIKFKVINSHQWDLLFPPSGNPPDSKTFDVTLLTVLLRNICGLPPPATGWNSMPPDTDRSQEANVTRIKLFRNEVYAHVSSTEVDNKTFEKLWQKISKPLDDLNIPQKEIDDLKTCSLAPDEEIYVKKLQDWSINEDDSKHMLADLRKINLQQQDGIETLKTSMQHLTQITEENLQGRQRLGQLSSLQSDSEESEDGEKHPYSIEEQLLQKFAKHNFQSKIRSKVKSFHPGTRDWLLKKVENWFTTEDESRLLLLTAGPGFGKSVFAAKVCQHFKEKDKLAACHFCDFSDSNLKDPMMMLQSLASHMSENVPGFRQKLVDRLKRPYKVNHLKDAFQVYLQNPLDELEEEPRLIVIDGLDESATDSRSDMVKLIADNFEDLPKCVKVLVTSRPEISIASLSCGKTIKINASDKDNGLDLVEYLKVCLPSVAARDAVNPSAVVPHSGSSHSAVVPAIVAKCEGSFLYAFHVQHELCKRDDLDRMTFKEIISFLPEGMGSVYKEYFHRLEMELEAVMKKKPNLFKLLEMLVAIEKTLPLTFLSRAFNLPLDCRETVKVIEKVNEAVSCLLFVSDGEVTVFHKSVYDWLVANAYKYHEYTVKVNDGKKRLWLVCKQIFEEIRRNVCLGNELNLTKDVKHALDYGHKYLLACNMLDNYSWLVDMIIVHVRLTVYPKSLSHLEAMLTDILERDDVAINLQLRQRMSWHLIDVSYLERNSVSRIFTGMSSTEFRDRGFFYLEAVLGHSPEGCFTDREKKIAKELLADVPRCIKCNSAGETMLNQLIAKVLPSSVLAAGVSPDKKLAAVALSDGSICVFSLPELDKLWKYPTGDNRISCCVFAPDNSIVLYGKLETALNIAERKEVLYFNGKFESFESCSFSPNGRRLATYDHSGAVKLWDVVSQCLLAELCAMVDLDFCRFSSTGLFIIGDRKIPGYDSYCVWNSITYQRVDQRSLSVGRKKDGVFSPESCNRCLFQERKELTPSKEFVAFQSLERDEIFTGIYRGGECIFYWCNYSLRVIESTHFTTLVAWQIFVPHMFAMSRQRVIDITLIEDDLWLCSYGNKLIVFGTVPPKDDPSCPSLPTRVLWCSFSPDCTRLATSTSNGFINLWNVDLCKVYQCVRSNVATLSAACYWSDMYLFVYHLNRGIPSLSKYPIDEKLRIETTEKQLLSLCPVVNEHLHFPQMVDFSYGYLIFNSFGKEPVKVFDVNIIGDPKPVVLPKIDFFMPRRVTVSAGGAFFLGTCYDNCNFVLWKKSEDRSALYKVHFCDRVWHNRASFSIHDSKCVVFSSGEHCVVFDINAGSETHSIKLKNVPEAICVADKYKMFCTNRVVIRVMPNLIQIYDLKSCEGLECSFQRNLTEELLIRSKLSPQGNILAVPRLTGDMDFFQLCIPESHSVSNREKNNRMMTKHS